MMKNTAFFILLISILVLAIVPAVAEVYVLDEIYASIDIPENYVVLTPDNLSDYADWLESRGTDTETCTNDYLKRGVLLQAWNMEENACFEVRAIQNDDSIRIFDVNEQSQDVRGQYRTSHYPDNIYPEYSFSSSDWKKTDEGRFLVLKYLRRDNGEILYRGFMRRTIRNGWQIDCDMQIYDRAVVEKDNGNLNKIWNTFHFIQVMDMPASAESQINIKNPPPTETNDPSFTVTGTAAEGVNLTTVVMGLVNNEKPIVSTVAVGKNRKFAIPVKLPGEGVYVLTITGDYKGEEVTELVYPITYNRTLLTVNFTSEPSDVLSQNELKISGTSEPGAAIQILIDGEQQPGKHVNTAGKFALTFNFKEEEEHEISLVFSKKGLADRRFSWRFTRRWTDADQMAYLQKQSIKPGYKTLVSKINGYTGRIMGYDAYLVDVIKSGEGYVLRMALSHKNKVYSSFILVTTQEKPSFAIDEKVRMYGTCEGMSQSGTGEEGEESLPCFSLLLLTSLE